MIVSLRSEAMIRQLETEKLKFLIAKLRREQFGPSSERGKLLVAQLELAIADIEESQGAAEAEADIAAPAAARQGRPARSRRPTLPDHLPVERIVYPAPCACAKCGGARLRKLDDVVSRSLECEPRRWKIVEHVREKMTCRDCDGVTETPAPSHPIPRGFAGPNLLASVLVSKFMLHQPLNRQSATFAREGIAIDTSTLADRVGACAVALAPIVEAIGRHVLAAARIHADDTTVPVLAKGKTDTGRLWTYVRDDRPFGGVDPPAAAFRYSRSRSGAYPREHLATYGRIMQADAYAGYNDLYDGRRKPSPIVEAACWSHGRRKLFDLAKLTKSPYRHGGGAPHRRNLCHRTNHQRPGTGRAAGCAPGAVQAADRGSRDLPPRETDAAVGQERGCQGHRLHPEPLDGLHPLPRRRQDLLDEQRSRACP